MSMMPPTFEAAPEKPKRNWTTIAVVVGLVAMGGCILLMIVVAAVLFPVYAQARRTALRSVGTARMKQLAIGCLIYSEDHDEHLPIATHWMDEISPIVQSEKAFHSPGLGGALSGTPGSFGIGFMESLSSASLSKLKSPDRVVLLFDSTLLQRNATSGLETLPRPPRYGAGESGGNIFGYADGHAARLDAAAEAALKASTPPASQ